MRNFLPDLADYSRVYYEADDLFCGDIERDKSRDECERDYR